MSTARQRSAEKAGFRYFEVPLACGANGKEWVCPQRGDTLSVERAVLSHLEGYGWRGFWGEGGLLLNLIKCMSFPELPLHHRLTYVEAIYAQIIAFEKEKVPVKHLLSALIEATPAQVQRNFTLMLDRGPFVTKRSSITTTSTGSVLDFFPGLEPWMLAGLFQVAGHDLLHRIASTFARDPYEYRRGWPDLTVWKDGQLRFVEVKAPGDSLGQSQKTIATTFRTPLGLDFSLAAVVPD
ncbi:VRR-NUC domain-containing protein [Stenotrophomonas sp. CFBP 13725]|uniref:VRR-NUC domain-containing protein n=1 Tax=Stenotrophomonas sp. CFBP 13725 TaxID=2775297 RepID=UPI00177B9D3F|nr:VRR-NUC domain-containing protein [Stenotrophomonas sp. CFBP 13725]MBD8636713.1 VRR-NUC domain-containing protein [Stenotrophomonas sp. CFBP 13725]